MNVESLLIRSTSQIEEKKELLFPFSNTTLISSSENSLGKTTLLRFLLYSMCFNIPLTKGIDENRWETVLHFRNSQGKEVVLERYGNSITIFSENALVGKYDLSESDARETVLSLVFESNEIRIISNIFGCMYVDQEYGWETTNSANYYGLIPFSCESLVDQKSQEIENLISNLESAKRDKKRYQALITLLKASENPVDVETYRESGNVVTELTSIQQQRAKLSRELSYTKAELDEYRKALNDNQYLVDVISRYQIRIRHESVDAFTLTKDDIDGYETSQLILSASIAEGESKLRVLQKKISFLDKEIQSLETVPVARTVSDQALITLKSSNIDTVSLTKIVEQLDSEIRTLNSRKRELIRSDNKYSPLERHIIEHLKGLKVYDRVKNTNLINGRFSKRLSGVELCNVSMAYKLGCLDYIREQANIVVPLIIDSPGTSERTQDNLDSLVSYVLESSRDRQVIISTVEKHLQPLFEETIYIYGPVLDNCFQIYSEKENPELH